MSVSSDQNGRLISNKSPISWLDDNSRARSPEISKPIHNYDTAHHQRKSTTFCKLSGHHFLFIIVYVVEKKFESNHSADKFEDIYQKCKCECYPTVHILTTYSHPPRAHTNPHPDNNSLCSFCKLINGSLDGIVNGICIVISNNI